MTRAETLRRRVEEVRAKISLASARWGHEVQLCAVTKTVDPEIVNLSYDAGIRIVGENRVQEAREKFPALNPNFALHMIGQLQTNKVKYILDFARMVQSLDRIQLALEIDRRAQARSMVMPALIQVNIAEEPQKAGISEAELERFARQCARLPGLQIQGLMAMMPVASDPEQVRPYFRRMRTWFERLKELSIDHVQMNCLSMGMSDDYIVAVEEGATMVRLGSALYKER